MTSPRGEDERGSTTKEPHAQPAAGCNLDKTPDWNRDLVQHSRDLLCVHDLKGQLLSANPESARLLGYTVEELLRVPMREMVPPDLGPQFDEYLEKIAHDGEAHGLLAVSTRSGEKRIWEYHNTLHRTEGSEPVVHGIAHDVTERVRAEKALREANEKLERNLREQESTLRELKLFRTLLDRTTDAIGVVEPSTLRFLDVNARACMELGYSREELLAMTAFDLDPSLTPEVTERMRPELLKAGYSTLTGFHRRKDGTTFPVEVHVGCVRLERDYMVAVSRDITERKKAEESLRQSEERYRSVVFHGGAPHRPAAVEHSHGLPQTR